MASMKSPAGSGSSKHRGQGCELIPPGVPACPPLCPLARLPPCQRGKSFPGDVSCTRATHPPSLSINIHHIHPCILSPLGCSLLQGPSTTHPLVHPSVQPPTPTYQLIQPFTHLPTGPSFCLSIHAPPTSPSIRPSTSHLPTHSSICGSALTHPPKWCMSSAHPRPSIRPPLNWSVYASSHPHPSTPLGVCLCTPPPPTSPPRSPFIHAHPSIHSSPLTCWSIPPSLGQDICLPTR